MRASALLAAIAVSSIASLPALAKAPARKQAEDREWTRERADSYSRLYDARKLISFDGTIVDIRYFAPGTGAANALVLIVELADGEKLSVHLGPVWFARMNGLTFERNDLVSVVGSRVEYQKKKIIMAAEITKGMTTLRIRSLDGTPLWRPSLEPST